MTKAGRILLITGPAGSGKSTLAERVSRELDWQNISEDEYWVNRGWGEELRTEEQEKVIQEEVLKDILSICQMGKSAVLEFILYKNPPNPLSAYIEGLTKASIEYDVVALGSSVDEILKRIEKRGRPSDIDRLEERRADAEDQIRYLDAVYVNPEWVIDSTNISEDALVGLVIERLKASA